MKNAGMKSILATRVVALDLVSIKILAGMAKNILGNLAVDLDLKIHKRKLLDRKDPYVQSFGACDFVNMATLRMKMDVTRVCVMSSIREKNSGTPECQARVTENVQNEIALSKFVILASSRIKTDATLANVMTIACPSDQGRTKIKTRKLLAEFNVQDHLWT